MSDEQAPQGAIDWGGAEVRSGTLTVPLAGEVSKDWCGRLEGIIERLQRTGGRTGAVKVSAKKLEVSDVAPGSEGDVRHFLEGAVQQVNAHFAPDEDEREDEDSGSAEDREMTEAFQSFAGDDDEDER